MPTVEIATHEEIESLYTDHHYWLHGWLLRRLGCTHQAADLAQDTFVRLMVGRRQSRGGEPRALLTHIAKGLLIDHWRRREMERAYLEAIAHRAEPVVADPEFRQGLIETLMEIDALLDGLPDRVRKALLLRQLDGLSYAAIARQLSVSVSSVEKYVARGLAACCLALERQ